MMLSALVAFSMTVIVLLVLGIAVWYASYHPRTSYRLAVFISAVFVFVSIAALGYSAWRYMPQ